MLSRPGGTAPSHLRVIPAPLPAGGGVTRSSYLRACHGSSGLGEPLSLAAGQTGPLPSPR